MKYNKHAIDEAITAIQESSGTSVTEAVLAVFDSLERAPWWEEVGEGYEFAPSEPWRSERQEDVNENRAGTGFTVEEGSRYGWTYFRDTRWTPPPAPLAVGDVIETVECLERLPEGTLLFSTRLHAYWMEKEGRYVAIGSDRWLVADEAAPYGPFAIRWLPELEATE